jgi:hypothetical protein
MKKRAANAFKYDINDPAFRADPQAQESVNGRS